MHNTKTLGATIYAINYYHQLKEMFYNLLIMCHKVIEYKKDKNNERDCKGKKEGPLLLVEYVLRIKHTQFPSTQVGIPESHAI